MSAPVAPTKPAASPFTRNHPFSAHVRENRFLNKKGSEKDTRHVVIELGSAGPTYVCGDSLGVLPRNPDRLVEEFLGKLGLSGDATLTETITASTVLNRAGKKFVKMAAEKSPASPARDRLQEVCADEAKLDAYVADRDAVDVLADAPGLQVDPAELPSLLPP
ncbi:MAG: sulfite reductase subunit alpha, partial [Verrucomicrobiota bacterium]